MKTPTYTKEQIIKAGQQLLEQDKTVTPFGIRNLIGGGNPTRIKAIWIEHSQKQTDSTKETQPKLELPSEFNTHLDNIKDHLDSLAKQLYNQAHQIAELRVQETISTSQKAKQQAEFETQEAMEIVTQQDEEIQTLKETIQTFNTQQKALEQQIAILNAQKEDLNKRLKISLQKEEQAKIEAAEIKGQLTILKDKTLT